MKSAFLAIMLACAAVPVHAQTIPVHAEGLDERLLTVGSSSGGEQHGVLSRKVGLTQQDTLVVFLPGYPSVVRPKMAGGVMADSPLIGNFLIRARRWLANERILILTVDCETRQGETCSSKYQASKERHDDVTKLINRVKVDNPTIKQVWLVGTSMGTISSAFVAQHGPSLFSGAIHTASITDFTGRVVFKELDGFNYGALKIPQLFIHHQNDPCYQTSYPSAVKIAAKHNIPLVTVSGGNNFTGDPCGAFTEHGFRGKEGQVMKLIADTVTGKLPTSGNL